MFIAKRLPGFRLPNGEDGGSPFDDLLAHRNIIMLTRESERPHGPPSDLIRSIMARCRSNGYGYASVRGFHIRSPDGFCDRCCGPHLVAEDGVELVTICDSGGVIRDLWGVEADAWIMVVDGNRNVLCDGPLEEAEKLATQMRAEAGSPQRVARAPPVQREGGGQT